jgi:fatty-acyl-CoA synthase
VTVREIRTYVDALVEALDHSRPVVRHTDGDLTGRELLALVHGYARALRARGIGPGALVALVAPNRPEAIAVRYAAHVLGAAAVYLSVPPDLARREALLAQLAPSVLVAWPETWDAYPGAVALTPVAGPEVPVAAQPEDLAVVISSGGTTGVPKGSLRSFATYTAAVRTPPRPERRQLANGRLAYLTQILVDQTLLGGGLVVLRDGYSPESTLDAIERERITDLFLVEPQLFGLMDHPGVGSRDLSSLRAVTHIGAIAAPVLRERARARLGPVVAHTYGASEIGIVSALSPAEHDRPSRFRCAGRIVPGVDLRLRAPDGALDPWAGSVEVRSPAMAAGYRNRSSESFADGWYRTGDRGSLDAEGMLRLDGRLVDVGSGPAVTDLQDTLCRQPSVRYAVLVGDPSDRVAAAEAWPGGEVDVAACLAAVDAEHGAQNLRILPVGTIPLTEQGKPNRPAIRARAAAAG